MSSAKPVRHLHVVDAEKEAVAYVAIDKHGESRDASQEVQALRDREKGLESDVAKWQLKYYELQRDKEEEARGEPLWEQAEAVFEAWKTATGRKPRTDFDWRRYRLIEPFLKKKKYGLPICLQAVAGIAYDHFSVQRKNGTTRHFNEWERVFKDSREVEERANAAPKGWGDQPHFAEVLSRFA